jgi:hypothetical protein
MATYKQIQAYVMNHFGWTPETCWIADVKSSLGISMRKAWNRKGEERVKPCPPEKRHAIEEALRHFRMI